MIEKIQAILGEIQSLTAKDEKELEALRIKYLGKKGLINDLMAEFRTIPAEQKRAIGIQLNELKESVQEKSIASATRWHKNRITSLTKWT